MSSANELIRRVRLLFDQFFDEASDDPELSQAVLYEIGQMLKELQALYPAPKGKQVH